MHYHGSSGRGGYSHLGSDLTIGHASAVVYRLKSPSALSASRPESLYEPYGSVRILVQLLMAAISPVQYNSASVSPALPDLACQLLGKGIQRALANDFSRFHAYGNRNHIGYSILLPQNKTQHSNIPMWWEGLLTMQRRIPLPDNRIDTSTNLRSQSVRAFTPPTLTCTRTRRVVHDYSSKRRKWT